jgi:hypothetical protein
MLEPAPPRFDVLLQGYLENSLTAMESAELLSMLQARPDLGTRLVDELAMTELLKTTVREADLQEAGLQASISSARRSSIRSVRIRQAAANSSTGFVLAAASAAIVVLATLFFFGRARHASQRIAAETTIEKKSHTTDWHAKEMSHIKTHLDQTTTKQNAARERLQELEAERLKLAGTVPQIKNVEQERLQVLKQLEHQRAQVERELLILNEARTNAEHELADLIAIQNVEPATEGVAPPPKTNSSKAVMVNVEIGRVQIASKSIGAIIVKPNGARESLRDGMALNVGDRIETTKAATSSRQAVLVLVLGVGATIDLADDTILECTQGHSLKLLNGLIYADVTKNYNEDTKRDGAFKLIIATPAVTAGVMGTRFELTANASSSHVRMEEGLISFFNESGRERVGALQECRAAAGSKPTSPTSAGNIWRGRKGHAKIVAVSFQDGALPSALYSGTEDTMIEQLAPASANGKKATLEVDGGGAANEASEMFALLRWKLPGIPKDTTVVGATLELNVTNVSEKRPFQIFEMLQPFSEQKANWKQFDAGNPWQAPGAQGNRDHNRQLLGLISPSSLEPHTAVLNEEGVAAVRRWIDSPDKNHGLLISRDPKTNNGFRFSSREAPDPALRPKLTIFFLAPENR